MRVCCKDINAELDADGGAWRNSFGQGALGVYAYKGVNYGVPWDMGMIGWWYNKALFEKAGISGTPTTWTEFNDDVDKLKTAGITPIAVGMGDKWPGMHMWAYLVTRLGGKANFEGALLRTGSFTDAPFVKAGEMLQALVAKQPFQDGFLGATYGDEATAMGNGKAAMELMGQWAPAVEKDNSLDKKGIGDNLGWFPFPMVEGGAGDPNDAVGGGNGFAIGKNASDAAVDFVKFLTSAENQEEAGGDQRRHPGGQGRRSGHDRSAPDPAPAGTRQGQVLPAVLRPGSASGDGFRRQRQRPGSVRRDDDPRRGCASHRGFRETRVGLARPVCEREAGVGLGFPNPRFFVR